MSADPTHEELVQAKEKMKAYEQACQILKIDFDWKKWINDPKYNPLKDAMDKSNARIKELEKELRQLHNCRMA